MFALALACCSFGAGVGADELDEELRRIAELEVELRPLAAPIMIDDASIRMFVNGQAVPFVVNTFMAVPPASRTLRFDMIDQRKPLMNSNGGALGCGWFVELNGHFWVTSLIDSLETRWAGQGKVVTDPVIRLATSIQPRGYVKPPPAPVNINCRWVQKCRWGICVPWYECTGRVLDCKRPVGGGFEVLPPRLDFAGTIDYSGVEITARPLTDLEQALVAAIGASPGITIGELAAKLVRPRPEIEKAVEDMKAAALVDDSGGWRLDDAVGEAQFRPEGIVFLDVVQPNVYYIINFEKCLDLPFVRSEDDPCLELKEEFPSGRLAASSVVTRQQSEFPIEIEDTEDLVFDGPWKGRTVRTNLVASRFEATEVGLGLDAVVHARWSQIAALEKYLRVHVTDTGNGEAILVEAPSPDPATAGKRLLIGAGSPRTFGRIVRYLDQVAAFGPDTTIDYFVVTHPGPGAMANALAVVDRYEVRTLIHPGAPGGDALRRLLRRAEEKGVQVVDLRREDVELDLGREAQAEILFSYDPELAVPWWRRAANASIVVKLTHGQRSFLLTGAIGKPVEEQLLASAIDLRADVLKVADSGSDSASSAPFLAAVSPRLALISAHDTGGWGSRPSAATVARLEAAGARIVSTSEGDPEEGYGSAAFNDDIVVLSDGDTLRVMQFDPTLGRWRRVDF